MRYLEKLSLHISWSSLYTHPIKITIDGVYLLIEPNMEIKYDPEQEENEQYDVKMKEVHKVEEFRKEQDEYGEMNIDLFSLNNLPFVERDKKVPIHKDTFLERLQLHLIRNLEVSISNIHITFEDKITKPNHPFAFGITLNYFKLQVFSILFLFFFLFNIRNFIFNRQRILNGNLWHRSKKRQLSIK
jgi:vacuolar protein sorting-associated protein 13A/C